MDMQIQIPSGKIFLNGHLVKSLKRNPYIDVNGIKSPLSEDEKRIAREMRKAFAELIDGEEQK